MQTAIWARAGVVYDSTLNLIFMATGNGNFDANTGGNDWGDSVFALHPDGTGNGAGWPVDSYTPTEYQALQNADADLGSTAPAILPVPAGSTVAHLGLQSGKDAMLRLLDLANLSGQGGPGHLSGELQKIAVPQGGQVLTAPAVWVNPADGATWVFIANGSGISGLKLGLNASNVPQLPTAAPGRWRTTPGGTSPIVANGILYVASSGAIRALDPTTGAQLWRDTTLGNIHWESPIVVNGRVYVTDESAHLLAYEPASYVLTVTTSGSGAGSVTSAPAGIDCGAACTAPFASGTVITLTATPTASSTFAGWSGEGCSGTGTCQVTMSQARSVNATFVSGCSTPPTITTFSVDAPLIAKGGSATLTWTTTGAGALTLNGGAVAAPTGSQVVHPTATTSYALIASNGCGSVSKTVVVNVDTGTAGLAPPAVVAPQTGQVLAVGEATFSWTTTPGASGYDLRMFEPVSGLTVLSATLDGATSTSTVVSLPDGAYTFAVRACSGAPSDATCGAFGSVSFSIASPAPSGVPTVTFPTQGATLSTSTQTLAWTSVAKVDPASPMRYEVVLTDITTGLAELQISVLDQTSTIFSLRSSTHYQLKVRACQAGCGAWSVPVDFAVTLPAIPSDVPVITNASVVGRQQPLRVVDLRAPRRPLPDPGRPAHLGPRRRRLDRRRHAGLRHHRDAAHPGRRRHDLRLGLHRRRLRPAERRAGTSPPLVPTPRRPTSARPWPAPPSPAPPSISPGTASPAITAPTPSTASTSATTPAPVPPSTSTPPPTTTPPTSRPRAPATTPW